MVEGLLERLHLSSEEKRSIKIGLDQSSATQGHRPQAVAKLLSEKIVHSDVTENSVGWIWCPIKGVVCKELDDNVFLITLNQEAGLRRALDEGPWMISKELLVVAAYEETKAVEEYDFSSIPIWMRVERLPPGMMNRAAAEAIGDDVGVFMEVDADGDDVGFNLPINID